MPFANFNYLRADLSIMGKGVWQYYFISIFLIFSFQSISQVCDGNLGENIFEDGDFGRGNSNVVSSDPHIAPGYIYQPNPPPNDGYYTITNSNYFWDNFPGWLKTKDNSTDIFGYMMVVNASNEPGLFYEKEITGLCENTLYAFSADIINIMKKYSNAIKPKISFLLDGAVVYTTSDIPEDEKWNTYGFTFTTKPGQNSLTLSLRNNAPGGIGNDLALDNISFRACGPEALITPEEITNICEDGEPVQLTATLNGNEFDTPFFQWQQSFDEGGTWVDIAGETGPSFLHTNPASGLYFYRYLVANGEANLANTKCSIISNEKIVNVLPKNNFIQDSICQGLSYTVGNSTYSSTGIYVDSLVNYLGCDSIVTLNLTVVPDLGISAGYTKTNPSCSYKNDGAFAIETVSNGVEPFSFLFEGNPYSIDDEIKNLPGGEFVYSIADRYGCRLESTVTLESPEVFIVELGPDVTVDLGDEIHLEPEANFPVGNYFWKPAELIDCAAPCNELNWPPPYSMYVSTTATSEQNCVAADSVYVTVDRSRKAYLPTAFSPNNDGLNDYFTVFGAVPNVQYVEKMAIFNRWGMLIFEKSNFIANEPTEGWDGTLNGKPVENGVYVYAIDIRFLDEEVIRYTGNVTLLK